MADLLEKRVETLERELAELKKKIGGKASGRDWLDSFGSARNDLGFDEMIRLGRQYRESLIGKACAKNYDTRE